MKNKFNQKLDEKMSKQKFSNCDLSYSQLEKITLRIEEITKPNNCIKKSNADFRMLRRFDLKYHSFNGTLIKKLVKKNTELMFVGTEDLFTEAGISWKRKLEILFWFQFLIWTEVDVNLEMLKPLCCLVLIMAYIS